MRKLIIATLLLGGFSAATFAQAKGAVEFGLNVGYNRSTVSTTYESAEFRNGFNIGFAADYYFSDRWSIKGKLIYDQKGWDNGIITDLDSGNNFITDYSINYLTVPVMANWHFGKKRNWYLDFGPYLGLLMSAEEKEFGNDVKDGFNSTDFGFALGIGVKIPVSNKIKLTFEYEGQSGLSNIFKGSNANVMNSRSSFNVGLNFLMK